MSQAATETLSPAHQKALARAHFLLENSSFAGRLAEYAGQPIERALRVMPKVATARLHRAVEAAVLNCLNVAINSIKPAAPRRPRLASALAGLSGGVSGFFGAVALPLELPVTTTLMLRAIAEIARAHGEDLTKLEARFACVEVFALGTGKSQRRMDVGYYASRALLSKFTGEASTLLIERGVAGASSTVLSGFMAELVSRYGIVVSERFAAGALPVIGAVGGATINVLFMNHFQRIAHAHFTIRRLERHYGATLVRRHYEMLAGDRLQSVA